VTADPSHVVVEPSLTIPRHSPFWRSPFGLLSVAAACVAVLGAVTLLVKANTPTDQLVTVRGIMASKQDYFNDEEVQRLLREHNLRVEVTARGSGELAYEVLNQRTQHYDFAFPSGQPAADLINVKRRERGLHTVTSRLFTSPMVLASYREYAETLVKAGAAKRHSGGADLYYTLDTAEFVKLGKQRKTWDGIGIGENAHPNGKKITNGNRVLARTSGVCRSNSGATYLGLLAYVENDNQPVQSDAEVDRVAREVQPLITGTGMPESDLWRIYVTPEGKSQGPIVVVYEHQFFAYQQDQRRRTGRPDTERVLLYPRQEFQTDPQYISLKPGAGDRLGRLLSQDRPLRQRMMELGFRVLDDTDETGTKALFQLLDSRGVPKPDERTDFTRAELPELKFLQGLAREVGGCQP
jgi:hypothetical protein